MKQSPASRGPALIPTDLRISAVESRHPAPAPTMRDRSQNICEASRLIRQNSAGVSPLSDIRSFGSGSQPESFPATKIPRVRILPLQNRTRKQNRHKSCGRSLPNFPRLQTCHRESLQRWNGSHELTRSSSSVLRPGHRRYSTDRVHARDEASSSGNCSLAVHTPNSSER